VFQRDDWIEAAVSTAEFLLRFLRRPEDGRWMRSWQAQGGARHLGYAADYAWLIDAFTRLAEATGEARWIGHAVATADVLLELFGDAKAGGVFTTGHDGEALIVRPKDVYDGATPAANSVAAVALARLGALTGRARYTEAAEAIVAMIADSLAVHALAFTNFLAAVDLLTTGVAEVAITGDRPDLVAAYRSRFLPNAVLAWAERYDSPLWEGREDNLAYVCRDFACRAPVSTVEDLVAQLVDSNTASTSSP
jgi:uncharacterized protein YyaL (SSP411 family)